MRLTGDRRVGILVSALLPAMIYTALLLGITWFAEMLTGSAETSSFCAAGISSLSALLCLPWLWREYKRECGGMDCFVRRKQETEDGGERSCSGLKVCVGNRKAGAVKAGAAKAAAGWPLAGAAAAPLLGAAYSGLSVLWMNAAGIYERFSDQTQEQLRSAPLWLAVAGLCLIVPAAEELIYRGLMYGRLKKILSAPAAALLMALLFAAGHGNVIQLLYAFPAALAMAWLTQKSGLAAAVLFHVGANLAAVLL